MSDVTDRDQGTHFTFKYTQCALKKGIQWNFNFSDRSHVCGLIDRSNQSLKEHLFKLENDKLTPKWIYILSQDLIFLNSRSLD